MAKVQNNLISDPTQSAVGFVRPANDDIKIILNAYDNNYTGTVEDLHLLDYLEIVYQRQNQNRI
jgi:hypothetical protein